MKPSAFDEIGFFQAVHESGARALLIGRRALVLLGIPVLTADYDYWISIEDIALFNAVCARFDLVPTRSPDEARRKGRYALENDEHIDVLVARSVPTVHGQVVEFDQLWTHRTVIDVQPGLQLSLPTVDDLILTKQFAARPKDLEDIRLLKLLQARGER